MSACAAGGSLGGRVCLRTALPCREPEGRRISMIGTVPSSLSSELLSVCATAIEPPRFAAYFFTPTA